MNLSDLADVVASRALQNEDADAPGLVCLVVFYDPIARRLGICGRDRRGRFLQPAEVADLARVISAGVGRR